MNANTAINGLKTLQKNSQRMSDVWIKLEEAATMLHQQQAALIAEQEHNEMLEAELKAMREQLNANQV